MDVKIHFTNRTICRADTASSDGAGAVVEFEGIVRGIERGAKISGLIYQIYEPMADRMVRRIVGELNAEYPCFAFLVVHRHGLVPVGETSIYVRIEALHRY